MPLVTFPRYIRITDISENNSLKNSGKQSLSPNIAKNYLLEECDILFARSGATVGKTFYYSSKYGAATFAGYLIKAKPDSNKLWSKFLYYVTLGKDYENWINSIFIQSTIQNIGADKYSQFKFLLPPLDEQKNIAEFLDKKCGTIDNIIEDKQKQLEIMREYKKSVIYEYVMGKKFN